jgi:hypothetical protein
MKTDRIRTDITTDIVILHLFSYFCLDSDSNTDIVNYAGYDTIRYRHHKYAIWLFVYGYGYGIGCWISGLGYGQIWTPINGFGLEYGRKISIPFSPLLLTVPLRWLGKKQHEQKSRFNWNFPNGRDGRKISFTDKWTKKVLIIVTSELVTIIRLIWIAPKNGCK